MYENEKTEIEAKLAKLDENKDAEDYERNARRTVRNRCAQTKIMLRVTIFRTGREWGVMPHRNMSPSSQCETA